MNPPKPFLEALHDFQCMARNRKPAPVIRYFLEILIKRSDLCEDGSILVLAAKKEDEKADSLLVWSLEDEDVNSIEELRENGRSLPINDGIASMAFRKRAPEYAREAERHPAFHPLPGQTSTDIGPIYCVPILTADREGEPFGVAAFQNRKGSDKPIEEEDRLKMRIAVKTLEAMLLSSPSKLVDYKQVFIVHGRNQQVRTDLVELLDREGIRSVVIQSKARTGEDLLKTIEDQSQSCIAGFILLTPDDEGRLYEFGQGLRQRARQNVIFEAGLLTALFRRTGRICFLRQGDLEIPSDLNGLLMETYGERIDEQRIRAVLQRWGFHVRTDAGSSGSPAAPAPPLPAPGPRANGTVPSGVTAITPEGTVPARH